MSVTAASVPITIRGRYFWRGDERFFIRGVAYQLHDLQDPISNERLPQLQHDILLFKELGLNTLFLYFIDNSKARDQAMKILEEAGIYVFTTISTPFNFIARRDPYGSYHRMVITNFFRTVDVMARYPNSLGLLAGSQVVNNKATVSSAPVVKAVVRDLKRYMKLKSEVYSQRILPIGYNAATTNDRDKTILNYLSLGDSASSIDFWMCNNYMRAGDLDMVTSGYEGLANQFSNVAIPIFMAEYGTNVPQPRLFQETTALYSSRISQVFSGGCVYEFYRGSSDYGIVELQNHDEPPDTPAWVSQLRFLKAQARANDSTKTAEKRETERGTLFIFHDFMNYKANLEATRGIEESWEGDVMENKAAERVSVDTTQINWPWEPEFQMPESCVDWAQLENSMKDDGSLHVV